MKKTLALILALVMVLCVFVGCGKKAEEPAVEEAPVKEEVKEEEKAPEEEFKAEDIEEPEPEFSMDYAGETITIFTRQAEKETWPEFAALVKEKTGIIVEAVAAPTAYGDLTTKLASVVTTGDDTYDIILVDELLAYTYQASGFIAPIGDAIDPYIECFPDSVVTDVIKVKTEDSYIMPLSLNPMMFYVNNDVLGETAVPTNKDEFIEAAKAMTDGDTYGLAAAWSSGGYLFNDIIKYSYLFDGDFYNWDDQNMRDAIQFMYDAVYTHKITPQSVLADNYTVMYQKMLEDQYGMAIAWSALAQTAGAENFGSKITIEKYPTFNTNRAVYNGWGMALNAASKKQEAALQVLKVWSSYEGQKVNAKYFDGTARMDVLADPEVLELKLEGADIQAYTQEAQLQARPMSVYVNEVQEIMESNVSAYLSQQITLDECCANVNAGLASIDF